MPLPSDFKEKLLKALADRKANSTCEICGQNDWSVVDQAISVQITDLSDSSLIPQPQLPCAGIICNNCGNVRLFALGALGLLPEEEEEGETGAH